TGTTTLTGNNTYFGPTNVTAGSLFVNGIHTVAASGLTSVASGATLGGAGTIGGSVFVADGGILTPGAAADTAGTLTIRGSLTLSGGSTMNYNFGQPDVVGGALNDRIVVNGNLTLDGTLNVSVTDGGAFGAGVYRVITYSGALTDNGLTLGTMPPGATTTLQTSVAGQVNLINSLNNLRFWDGATLPSNGQVNGGTGIWNSGAGANINWTDVAGAANGVYSPGFAVFQGAAGTVTVDNSGGQVVSEGMQFARNGYLINGGAIDLAETTVGSLKSTIRVGDGTGAGAGYTATIDSVLQGSVEMVKADLGTLVLTGTNTYSGGTTISGGILQLGNGGATGSIVGDVTNSGTLTFNRDNTYSFDGAISGTGAVRQIGTGTTVLTADNSYAGTTTITAGTLQIGGGGTTGTLGGGAVTVSAPGLLAFNHSDTVTYGGVVSGTGALEQRGTGIAVLTGANTYTGGTTINGGELRVASESNLGNISSNLTFNGGTLRSGATLNRNIVVTSSDGTVVSSGGTFNGNISGAGFLRFAGGGTTTINGTSNTYSGGTILSEGATVVIGSAGALGTGKITGQGASPFTGSGGGTLRTTATMTLTNAIDLGETSFFPAGNLNSINFNTDAGTTLTLTGNINNVGGFHPANGMGKDGTGTLVLANTVYGNGANYAVRVRQGILRVGNGGAAGTIGVAPVAVSTGAQLVFDRSDAVGYSGAIS
ncbi:MAG TPA: autotransporter-associated beta strand repeat-containing protein, partial [Luteolibacter sp.]